MTHLFYTTPEKGTNTLTEEAISTKNMLELHRKSMNNNDTNTYQFQGFETSSIFYLVDYPADSNSWDSKAHLIFIFGTNSFMEIDTKNIALSLYRITFFIRNRNIYGKTKKDILDILGFK